MGNRFSLCIDKLPFSCMSKLPPCMITDRKRSADEIVPWENERPRTVRHCDPWRRPAWICPQWLLGLHLENGLSSNKIPHRWRYDRPVEKPDRPVPVSSGKECGQPWWCSPEPCVLRWTGVPLSCERSVLLRSGTECLGCLLEAPIIKGGGQQQPVHEIFHIG